MNLFVSDLLKTAAWTAAICFASKLANNLIENALS